MLGERRTLIGFTGRRFASARTHCTTFRGWLQYICQSAPSIEASEDGPPTCIGAVLLQLVKSFATARAKANMNPPPPVPQVTGAHT
jgi:hypothetical protein